jgi:hypothetical protein
MRTIDRTDSLLSAIPFERITSWTVDNLGVNGGDFSAIVARLEELEDEGLVDVLSITRERNCGSLQVTAIKFFRTLRVD